MNLIYCLLILFSSTYAFIHNTRIVLLPGYGCSKNDYKDIIKNCKKQNVNVDIVPISRLDWLRSLKCILNKNYWSYNLTPYNTFDWYLEKAKTTIKDSIDNNDGYPIVLCGHSAGGWLARALMANGTFYNTNENTYRYVSALITLGTPNIASSDKKHDATHGCLSFVDEHFPGTFLKSQGIQYITLGSYSKRVSMNDKYSFSKNSIILNSYLTVLGDCEKNHIYGDGIVPLDSSHLKGSIQLTYPDVFHFKRDKKRWYGDESVVNDWLYHLNNAL